MAGGAETPTYRSAARHRVKCIIESIRKGRQNALYRDRDATVQEMGAFSK
jgi:hypothetical protein